MNIIKLIYEKNILIFQIFFLFINIYGQNKEFYFNYIDNNSIDCNPFYNLNNETWKVSHGSPFLNFQYQVSFEAKNELSEGLYAEYKFQCAKSYSFEVVASDFSGDHHCDIVLYAANDLTQITESDCELGEMPNVEKTEIFRINGSDLEYMTNNYYEKQEWYPDNEYNYLWIVSENETQYIDEALVYSISIDDKGYTDNEPPSETQVSVDYHSWSGLNNHHFNLSWNESFDNSCVKGYRIGYNNTFVFVKGTDTTLNVWAEPCSTFLFTITAIDYGNNNSEITSTYFEIGPNGQEIVILKKDFTDKNQVLKEATKKIIFDPGFKFDVNENDDYFIGRIKVCSLKNDSLTNQDSLKTYLVDNMNNKPGLYNNFDFIIIPNPCKGEFEIKTENIESGEIFVYDITGELVLTQIFYNIYSKIILSNKIPGIYTVRLLTENIILTKKIIVN